MFKSIEYKLILYLTILIVSVAALTYTIMMQQYIFIGISVVFMFIALQRLRKYYSKFNQNILFLLNALDNGDYSFSFSETVLSRREKELNHMMNRIKDILTKARKEVIENETFLSMILESVSTGIIIMDDRNTIRNVNRSVTQMLGLSVLTHLNQLKPVDESFPELFRNLQPTDHIQIKVNNEREETQISVRLSVISMKTGLVKVITLNNIGNELEAKELDSWIRLIRVMTHEIMNSIAPVTSLSEMLLFNFQSSQAELSDLQLKENTVDALETINTTARGLMSFVESYRRFTGIPKPQLSPIEILPVVKKVIHLEIPNAQERGIDIQIDAPDKPVMVNADESQINQVLVNLLKNASEAIHPNKEGIIQIKIAVINSNPQIDVSNNGQPIPEEVLPHIFIPFFTTKEGGTGVGLSISRYIMRLHGGNLKHHTKNDQTTFSMIF